MEKYLAWCSVTAAATSLLWFLIFSVKKIKWEVEKIELTDKLRKLRWDYEDLLGAYNRFSKTYSAPKATYTVLTKLAKAYQTLGLDETASRQEVKNKYKMLVKKYHPDVYKSDPSNKRFKEINEAYSVIKDKLGI